MENSWLGEGEEIIGSWHIYLGEEGPNSAKITGKMYVTNRNIHFEAGISLDENAGNLLSKRIKAYEKTDKHMAIPLSEIREVKITKKSLFQKTLLITLKSNEEIPFHFGAMSPQKALDAITSRL